MAPKASRLVVVGILALGPRMATGVHGVPRRQLFALSGCGLIPKPALSAAASSALSAGGTPSLPLKKTPRVTQRGFLDLRIIESYNTEVLEDMALRGRLEVGLYGESAPEQTERFVQLLTGRRGRAPAPGGDEDGEDSFPRLSSAQFDRMQPGELLLSGRIVGLEAVPLPESLGGTMQWQWNGRSVPLRPVLESTGISHARRGLLTHEITREGPYFGITLGPAPALDRDWAVFGEVVSGSEWLAEIEALPVYTGRAAPGSQAGGVGAAIFDAQRRVFTSIGTALGDTRSEENVGRLLRRVEITKCGLLP